MSNPVELSVDLAGVHLKNPVVVASGTFGFGKEYGAFYDLSELGGICCKGLTPARRERCRGEHRARPDHAQVAL